MNITTTLGIDVAKNVFQIHGVDYRGKATIKEKISRKKLPLFLAKMNKCNIFMETCGSSNYWGREAQKYGHTVKLIPAAYVKPFVKTSKNDANDAEAIVEAGSRPSMRFAEVKTTNQQDIQCTHRIRSRIISNRTALANEVRGLLAEYGIVIPQGIHKLRAQLPGIIAESEELSGLMKDNVTDLYQEFKQLDEQVKKYDDKIKALCKNNDNCKLLESIPGIGPLTASILASILGNGGSFKNGRNFAAFLGLVPRQHSSGGKTKLYGITKHGDNYVRMLLAHGARNVIRYAGKKNDLVSCWINKIVMRRGANRATIALAAKMARMALAVIKSKKAYNAEHKLILGKAA
jgi:transposase